MGAELALQGDAAIDNIFKFTPTGACWQGIAAEAEVSRVRPRQGCMPGLRPPPTIRPRPHGASSVRTAAPTWPSIALARARKIRSRSWGTAGGGPRSCHAGRPIPVVVIVYAPMPRP